MVKFKKKLYYNLKYNLKCWMFIPVTFIRRVLLSKDQLGRRFFWDKWGFLSAELVRLVSKRDTVWIIASSGGEVTQSISLFKKIKERFPGYNLIVSTESYDTFRYVKKLDTIDFVFFPPWDMPAVCRKVLKKIMPKAVIVIERCYYPVLLKEAKKINIRTLMCSGLINFLLLNDNFLMQRSFDLSFFDYMDKLAVKSDKDAANLSGMGVKKNKISVLGEMKFDLEHCLMTEDEKNRLKQELGFSGKDMILIVGSIHQEEIDLVLDAFRRLRAHYPEFKLILAPRWTRDIPFIIEEINEEFTCRRRSELNSSAILEKCDILILDTFGELPRFYGIADVSFIAGSIIPFNARRQGHSIFEPLAHGIPVVFGPHLHFWRDFTDQLKEAWPGCQVNDAQSLSDSISVVLKDAQLRERCKVVSQNLSKPNFGIVQKHMELVGSIL